jgi:hypothetical protein
MSSPIANTTEATLGFSGLICGHSNCRALFAELDDAVSHADICHDGDLSVSSCSIREVVNTSGVTEKVFVPEDGELFSAWWCIPDQKSTRRITEAIGCYV